MKKTSKSAPKAKASTTTAKTDVKTALALRDALDRSQAVIEFDPTGIILAANANFLAATGYALNEIVGQHHRIFCDADYARSADYAVFWAKLGRGDYDRGEYRRFAKDGREIWLSAAYNPVRDDGGKVIKVVKFAMDITAEKSRQAESEGQMSAVSKSQAVIEFTPQGKILTANENFLKTVGYALSEIQGQHHRMFCDPKMAESIEYLQFWEKLARGQFDSGEYKRRGRNGKEIWLQASYNPILDASGRVTKVVKFASDITAQKLSNMVYEGKVESIGKVQAIIEFNVDGTVRNANENFLKVLGYDLNEIQGKHHRMFVDADYAKSPEYKAFWEKLSRGEYDANAYKRIGKGGREVWIQASYNPIVDDAGKVIMVVKFATDITAQRRKIMEFEGHVQTLEHTAESLAQAASQLTSAASMVEANARRTNDESMSVTRATDEVASGVQTVAVNTEEMVASIKEISRSANASAEMSRVTSQKAQETNDTVTQLGLSSQEIGEVIKVISSIAQQTNLLALNATIEAARAGDAGKGFAVVANEVKELAKQTAKATQDITNKIGAIQKDSTRAVEAIGAIAADIDKLNGLSGTIAAAVEEQTATTNEVSRIIQMSSRSVQGISSSIRLVSSAAEEGTVTSSQTLASSKALADLAGALREVVKRVKAS